MIRNEIVPLIDLVNDRFGLQLIYLLRSQTLENVMDYK